jgi:hypothetical protein
VQESSLHLVCLLLTLQPPPYQQHLKLPRVFQPLVLPAAPGWRFLLACAAFALVAVVG